MSCSTVILTRSKTKKSGSAVTRICGMLTQSTFRKASQRKNRLRRIPQNFLDLIRGTPLWKDVPSVFSLTFRQRIIYQSFFCFHQRFLASISSIIRGKHECRAKGAKRPPLLLGSYLQNYSGYFPSAFPRRTAETEFAPFSFAMSAAVFPS